MLRPESPHRPSPATIARLGPWRMRHGMIERRRRQSPSGATIRRTTARERSRLHALDGGAGRRRRMSGLNRPDTDRRNPVRVLVDLAREKGDCFVYLPGKPQSFLANRPEYVRQVLVERTDIYSKDTIANAGFTEHVSAGLLTSEGETWLRQRKLMR